MLRFLLDEHISPVVARRIVARTRADAAIIVAEWAGGDFLAVQDDLLLDAARKHGLTLVTYDCRTIPVILKRRGEEGVAHGGVIFVDQCTLAPNDFGGLVRALVELWEAQRGFNWTNRIVYLKRSG